jgi:hypothetical protein
MSSDIQTVLLPPPVGLEAVREVCTRGWITVPEIVVRARLVTPMRVLGVGPANAWAKNEAAGRVQVAPTVAAGEDGWNEDSVKAPDAVVPL